MPNRRPWACSDAAETGRAPFQDRISSNTSSPERSSYVRQPFRSCFSGLPPPRLIEILHRPAPHVGEIARRERLHHLLENKVLHRGLGVPDVPAGDEALEI